MAINVSNYANLQGFRLAFFLNGKSSDATGIIYVRFKIGKSLYRFSTGLRIKREYWNKSLGCISVRRGSISDLDLEICTFVDREINEIHGVVQDKIKYYLCGTDTPLTDMVMGNELVKIISNKLRMKKKKVTMTDSLLCHLEGLVMEYDRASTQKEMISIVNKFRKFMEDKNIKDNLTSLNMETMRAWRDWLEDSNLSAVRSKNCFNVVFMLIEKIEKKRGYDFGLKKDKIEGFKDLRTGEEKRRNGLALTEEEIERLEALDLQGKEKSARDMFLLQCWCGCRVEDIPLLLDSKNIKTDNEGVVYSTFVTQKKKITATVPLNTLYPKALGIVETYKDSCPFKRKETYNKLIKSVSKLAGLDRIVKYVGQKANKKYEEEIPLYDYISSHDGRHTFITNCIRYKGLEPNKVKIMTGHADSKIIEAVYCNQTTEDNQRILKEAIKRVNVREDRTDQAPSNSPNEFAQWLVKELGIKLNGNYLSLTKLMNKLGEEKRRIIREYGKERYLQIKQYLGIGLGDIDKERLEKLFLHVWPHIPRPKIIGISKVNRTDLSKLWDLEEEVEF